MLQFALKSWCHDFSLNSQSDDYVRLFGIVWDNLGLPGITRDCIDHIEF